MKPRVLFIDDEAALSGLLSLYFQHNGIEVTAALDGQAAREALRTGRFNAVILDLNLGGEDGLTLLALIKDQHPDLPVIIFTGSDVDEHFIKKCLAERADGFMRKTEGLPRLLAQVKKHLAEIRAPDSPAKSCANPSSPEPKSGAPANCLA